MFFVCLGFREKVVYFDNEGPTFWFSLTVTDWTRGEERRCEVDRVPNAKVGGCWGGVLTGSMVRAAQASPDSVTFFVAFCCGF